MNLRLKYFIVVNVCLCLVGVIFILIGVKVGDTLIRPTLEAIGIGLLAAGAVNILDRSLTLEPPPPPIQRIDVVAETRFAIPQSILDLKYRTGKVDVVGISLNHFLEELINDKRQEIITRLLNNNLQLRIFFVHPDSKYLEQRACEDRIELSKLQDRQRHAVQLCVGFFKQLETRYKASKKAGMLDAHNTGNLQIKLLDFCPYTTIYRIGEEDIYWGLYTSGEPGVNLPLFKTSERLDPSLYKHLHKHIHGLIDRDAKYPDLVCMTQMGEPILNEEFAATILQKSSA